MTTPHRVILIDDEPLARRRLRQLLAVAPDFDVVAECGDARAAAALVRAHRPVVAFVDVRMPHLDGFEVRDAIGALVRHVVFVTAHAEHAARGFDVAATDYLVKPVIRTRFAAALDRLRAALAAESGGRVVLGGRQGGAVTRRAEVGWLEARGAYVAVHAGARRHVLRASLGRILSRLGGAGFVRIHRSFAVNLDHVTALCRGPDGLEVRLRDGRTLPVSRRQAGPVLARLNGSITDRSQPGPTAGDTSG